MTLKNNRAPLLCYFKLCASFRSHWWIPTGVTVWKRPIWVKIDDFFYPCDLEIWRMTFKNNEAHLLSNIMLYASFHDHMWVQTGVKSPESTNLGQIRQFSEPCYLEIWRMTLNKANLRDLIAATGLVILPKLDSYHRFFSPSDLEIWLMTSKNYRAPLLHYITLCASFQTPRWIRTWVTVQKPSIRVKIGDFLPCVT